MNPSAVVLGWMACGALAACHPETRLLDPPPMDEATAFAPTDPPRDAHLRPARDEAGPPPLAPRPGAARYEASAAAVAQGRRLYGWFNCNGCHATGGGDMGPPLLGRFGNTPESMFKTIVEGRPNGMPSFGGRISEHQAWQIVAYVQSMSGQREDAMPSRADALSSASPGNDRLREAPSPPPGDPANRR